VISVGIGFDYSISDKKLKDSLDELEELLEKYTVTRVTYLDDNTVQVPTRHIHSSFTKTRFHDIEEKHCE